jgi:5-methylcytosine-specific restriction endonuclease McrA
MKSCSVDGCEQNHKAKGYCATHYTRLARRGDPHNARPWKRSETGLCTIEGCGRRHDSRGLCSTHAWRVKHHNDPHYVRPRPVLVCQVEGCDREKDAKGYCTRHYKQHAKGGIIADFRTCKRCGSPYERPRNGPNQYCGSACRLKEKLEVRQKNPERVREREKKWRAENPERVKHQNAKRRAALWSRDSRTVTVSDIRNLIARHDGMCAYCQDSSYDHIDHVVPLSRGGRHAIGNLMPACAFCNLSKNASTLSEWRYGRGAERVAI